MDEDHVDSHDEPIIPFDERIASVNNNDPSVNEIQLPKGNYYGGEDATEDQIRALFRGMRKNTHVRKLDLCWTPRELRRTVCQELLPPLLRENSSIEYLRFPRKMTNAELLPSVDDLCNNNNMTVKDLGINSCDIRGHDGGEMIGRLIRNNHHITTIDLKWNTRLGPAGVTRIAAALGDENCALKSLYLGFCGIGDEGVDALCTALQVNNSSLETFWFESNNITNQGYRALARSLPCMSGLKKIRFVWEPPRVSAAVLQQMMDGLHKNQSLQRITTYGIGNMSAEQFRKWEACCAFVGARNKMKSHLLDEVRDAARDGRVAPVPIPICSLLWWCRRHGNSEVQASLIHLLLRSRSNEIAG